MSWFGSVVYSAERAGPWKMISFIALREAAESAGLTPAEGEIYCLEQGYVPSRYIRSMGTIGLDGQRALLNSSAAVIGCGGLGGLVADLLARAGVGRLVFVDDDVFDDTNLNRQILATEALLGLPKAKAAAERAKAINGAVEAEGRQCCFDAFTAPGILEGVDIVLDCLDSLSTRRLLFAECAHRRIPLVSAAIAGFWGQVGMVMPGKDSLHGYLAGESDAGVEVETGNPPFTPALVAALEVAQAVKYLAGKGSLLEDQLLWVDLAEDEFNKLNLR